MIEPDALQYIPKNVRFDFPDLVHKLLEAGERVGAYRYRGMWFDIGRADDYERAVEAWFRQANGHPNGSGQNGDQPPGHEEDGTSDDHATGLTAEAGI